MTVKAEMKLRIIFSVFVGVYFYKEEYWGEGEFVIFQVALNIHS